MSKRISTVENEIITCDNCDREIKRRQSLFHGVGICSKEPTEIEKKIAMVQAMIKEIQQESKARSAFPLELQERWDEICANE